MTTVLRAVDPLRPRELIQFSAGQDTYPRAEDRLLGETTARIAEPLRKCSRPRVQGVDLHAQSKHAVLLQMRSGDHAVLDVSGIHTQEDHVAVVARLLNDESRLLTGRSCWLMTNFRPSLVM